MFHYVGSELAIANGLPQPIGASESFLHHFSGHQNILIATKLVVNASVYVPMTSSGSGSDCAWSVHLSGPCLCSPLNLRPKRDRRRVWSFMLSMSTTGNGCECSIGEVEALSTNLVDLELRFGSKMWFNAIAVMNCTQLSSSWILPSYLLVLISLSDATACLYQMTCWLQ